MSNTSKRGRRVGSGLYGEPTTTIRVPLSQIGWLKELLQQKTASTSKLIFSLPRDNHPVALPKAGALIPAGFPSPAQDYLEDFLDPNDLLVPNRESTFVLQVAGESMIDLGILPGDYVTVDRSREAVSGDIVIAVIDGEPTIKTLRLKGKQIWLEPANTKFPTLVLKEHQELTIWGVVVGSFRKFNR